MTYHELVKTVRTALVVKADASKIEEHIAAQVNVTGEAEGAFYIEIKEDAANPIVEPYTYNDRDFLLTGDGEEILAVAQGKKTLEAAIVEGTIAHEGNWEKTLVLSNIIPAAEKPAKKSAKAKKEEAPKAEEPEEGQLALGEEASAPAAEEVKAEAKAEEKTKGKGGRKKKDTASDEKPKSTRTTRKPKPTANKDKENKE